MFWTKVALAFEGLMVHNTSQEVHEISIQAKNLNFNSCNVMIRSPIGYVAPIYYIAIF